MAHRAFEWMEKSDRARRNVLNSSLCNLVIIAYSKINDSKEAVEKSYSFMLERIDCWNKGDTTVILPTMVGIGAGLLSLGKERRVDDALHLLELVRVLSDGGVPDIMPDEGCYMNILSPLARSQEANVAEQALSIVKRMKADLGTVTTASLNSAINTCSKIVGTPVVKRKAIEPAFLLFQLGRESESCDATTYGLMIKTCINLVDDENARLKYVEVS